jgi:hypothetical protein
VQIPVEDGPVEVGLGVEVAVEDHAADLRLGRHVVEAGGGEACVGEGGGGGGEDLFPPFGTA